MSTEDLARELAAESKPPNQVGTYILLAGPLYAFLMLGVVLFYLFAMPWLDGVLWPVLSQHRVSQVTWSPKDRKLCWIWEFTKTQIAKPVHIAFEVGDSKRNTMTVFPMRADTGASFAVSSGVQRLPGRHLVPLCAAIPEEIVSPWVVSGYIDYQTPRWWIQRVESPPIMPDLARSTDGSNG